MAQSHHRGSNFRFGFELNWSEFKTVVCLTNVYPTMHSRWSENKIISKVDFVRSAHRTGITPVLFKKLAASLDVSLLHSHRSCQSVWHQENGRSLWATAVVKDAVIVRAADVAHWSIRCCLWMTSVRRHVCLVDGMSFIEEHFRGGRFQFQFQGNHGSAFTIKFPQIDRVYMYNNGYLGTSAGRLVNKLLMTVNRDRLAISTVVVMKFKL